MSKPKKSRKSEHTLVRLGPKLDQVVQILGNQNSMSYSATVRLLVILGTRGLIKSGTFQGWVVPEGLEAVLDGAEVQITMVRTPKIEVSSPG
jgi:hypothetical protein